MNIVCEHCGKPYKLERSRLEGKTVRIRCKRCGKAMTVRADQPSAPDPGAVEEVPVSAAENNEASAGREPESRARAAVAPSEGDPPAGMDHPADTAPTPDAPPPFRKGLGIWPRITVLLLLAALLPAATLAIYAYRPVDAALKERQTGNLERLADGLSRAVNARFDADIHALRMTAELPAMLSMMRGRQTAVLDTLRKSSPWFRRAAVLGRDGREMAASDSRAADAPPAPDGHAEIMAGNALFLKTVTVGGKTEMHIVVPVRAGPKVLGSLAAFVSLERLQQLVAEWHDTCGCHVLVLDGVDGRELARSAGPASIDADGRALLQAWQGREGATMLSFTGADGGERIGAVRKTRVGWIVGAWQPKSSFRSRMAATWSSLLLSAAGFLVLIALAAWLFARSQTRPLRRMLSAVEKMGRGNLNVDIEVASRDEIGRLAAALDHMQRQLHLDRERRSTEMTEALQRKRVKDISSTKNRFSAQRKG
jgi:predicted Zn finger-like uncharacterized protein